MGLFDFFKKNKGINEAEFYSTQFQNSACAIALWKLEQNNLNNDAAASELKKIGLNDEQVQYILDKVHKFLKEENNGKNNNPIKIKPDSDIDLKKIQKTFFENNQSYEAVKTGLQNEGYHSGQIEKIMSELKIMNTRMVNDFQQELDSGNITGIKITPNPEHTKENTTTDQAGKYIGFGAFQMERGDLDNALELFDKAIEIDNEATLAYANKAILFSKKGEYGKALEFYNKALEIEPDNIQILENKMEIFFDLMDVTKESEFIETVQRLLKNDPENPDALIYITQYYLKNNDTESALRSAKLLFARHHREHIAIQLLLNTLARLSPDRVLEEFEKYKGEIDKHAQYQLDYTRGLYLKGLNRFDEAILVYENLNKLQDFSWNYYQMAIMKNLQGKIDESLALLKITFDLEPGLKEDAKQFHELENLRANPTFIALIT